MNYWLSIGIPLSVILLIFIIAVIYKPFSIYRHKPNERNVYEGKKVIFIYDKDHEINADGVRGYLKESGTINVINNKYIYFKRVIDIIFSFFGLVVLIPVFIILAIIIFINNPGPIFFVQKRVGENKKYFKLHKFRTMKCSAPHNIPTHMLSEPEKYITKVGKFMRKHSIDELPQIWDILVGNMSIIGPRPALWNQDLLISERDKYDANNVKPGLTGLAQIKGRDKLAISEKAKLDGEYITKFSLKLDTIIFFKSFVKIGVDKNNVEGNIK